MNVAKAFNTILYKGHFFGASNNERSIVLTFPFCSSLLCHLTSFFFNHHSPGREIYLSSFHQRAHIKLIHLLGLFLQPFLTLVHFHVLRYFFKVLLECFSLMSFLIIHQQHLGSCIIDNPFFFVS